MKKLLLFVIAFMCVSIGARAEGEADGYLFGFDTWRNQTNNESAVTIHLSQSGVLAAAINEINNGAAINGKPLKDCDIVYIDGESISDADLTALSNLNFQTIMLGDVAWTATSKSFTNANVRYLILPFGWTKDDVNSIGATMSQSSANFGSCLSLNDFSEDVCYSGTNPVTKTGYSLTAYVNEGNTLWATVNHTYLDSKPSKLGTSQYNGKISSLFDVAISGYPVARDFYSSEQDFTPEGHIVFNEPADETKHTVDDVNIGVSGNVRYPVGDGVKEWGALENANVVRLDLSDAIIYPQWIDDLNLSISGMIGENTKRVDIPTNPIVETLPADFMNADAKYITQVCIPGNIKNILTRAFNRIHLYHVWTTSNKENLKTDNGVVIDFDENDEEVRVEGFLPYDACQILYGSITLPPNLELIESGVFMSATEIKDVYSLNPIAPECHVDAFNSQEYVANDHYDAAKIAADGIVTRDAYLHAGTYKWMTLLHYPRESKAPDIQRYTDPTRRYSIASGDKDGNGATIYYPNRSEYNRSYLQGTFGYLWNSWDTTREQYINAFRNTIVEGSDKSIEDYLSKAEGYTDERQDVANAAFLANALGVDTKKYTSFYDVTEGGKVGQPNGLRLYSDVYWDENRYELNTEGRGVLLYPAAQYSAEYFKYNEVADPSTFTGTLYEKDGDEYVEVVGTIEEGKTYYSRVQTQDINEDGSLKYDACTDGTFVAYTGYQPKATGEFVKDLEITEASDGRYVKEYSWIPAENGNGDYVRKFTQNEQGAYYKEYAYVEDENGNWAHPSWDANAWITDFQDWQQKPDKPWYNKVLKDIKLVPEGVYTIDGSLRGNLGNYEPTNGFTGEGLFYNKEYTAPVNYITYDSERDLADEPRYNVIDNGYRAYNAETDEGLQRYAEVTLYREAAEGETGAYCPAMVDAKFRDLLKKNDYRGWHQFVLVANATNSEIPFETLKSFITDNDWWTICVPYDLTYNDMVYLFGDKKNKKIPYLSKLLYVVRDVKNTHITLMFSKNLMEYKEQFLAANGSVTGFEQFPDPSTGKTSGRVHGYIDESDAGKWKEDEINRNPVILHAGVPYMIRPEIPDGGSRQFDIYRHDQFSQDAQAALKPNAIADDGLWARLNEAKNLSGDEQKQLVYNGEYQVPAYVINNTDNSERTKGDNGVTITMNDGSTFTYPAQNGETEETQFLFKNNRYKMEISDVFDYTFVGSFYKSLMPQYSYFLGWNPNATNRYGKKGAAAFWYNRVNDTRNWTWNNETGVICANWSLNKKIEDAAVANKEIMPARWEARDGVANDDFTVGSSTSQNARGYMPWTFDNGMKILIDGQDPEDVVSEGDGVPDAINNVNAESKDGEWYNVNGQKLNRKPVTNGVYIKNGKKYVVK